MEHTENRATIRSIAALNALFGIWMIVSPYVLTYTTSQAKWEQTIAGIAVVILAGIRYMVPSQIWASWLNALVGLWMIVAPFATGYQSGAAYWNEVIFGALVLIFGVINAATHVTATHHHGRGAHHAT